MRLINANTLKGEFTGNFVDAYPTALVHALIDSAPTVDAVPVVRCKDCKHGQIIGIKDKKTGETIEDVVYCEFLKMGRATYDYCSYGARMDGDK